MKTNHPTLSKRSQLDFQQPEREAGYLLVGVLFLVAAILLTLATAVPAVVTELRRDKEYELYHRGLQYSRAIRLYYKRFGTYPSTIEQMEKTNEIRFLRRRYKDPITAKDEWRLIHAGEAKVSAVDLYGPPVSAAKSIIGASSVGGPAVPQAFTPSGSGSAAGPFASSQNSINNSLLNQTDAAYSNPAGTTSNDASSGISSSGAALTGKIFGGGGIVGVSSTSSKQSIREYKKQQHYNQWEFTYDASQEVRGAAGIGLQQPQAPSTPIYMGGTPPPSTPAR